MAVSRESGRDKRSRHQYIIQRHTFSDIFSPIRPHFLIVQSILKLQCINLLMSLIPSGSNHLTAPPPTVDQVFNTMSLFWENFISKLKYSTPRSQKTNDHVHSVLLQHYPESSQFHHFSTSKFKISSEMQGKFYL
jgi:hypothetical protein